MNKHFYDLMMHINLYNTQLSISILFISIISFIVIVIVKPCLVNNSQQQCLFISIIKIWMPGFWPSPLLNVIELHLYEMNMYSNETINLIL